MPRQAFPYTTFSDMSGAPLANGYVLIEISDDVQAPDGQMCRGMLVNVALDSSGVLVSTPQVWANASLLPSGSCYVLRAYTKDGELALGPITVTV